MSVKVNRVRSSRNINHGDAFDMLLCFLRESRSINGTNQQQSNNTSTNIWHDIVKVAETLITDDTKRQEKELYKLIASSATTERIDESDVETGTSTEDERGNTDVDKRSNRSKTKAPSTAKTHRQSQVDSDDIKNGTESDAESHDADTVVNADDVQDVENSSSVENSKEDKKKLKKEIKKALKRKLKLELKQRMKEEKLTKKKKKLKTST